MGRRTRNDYEGSWHHVFNRAIAKRSMFETAADVGRFLGLLGMEVGRGRIEVHAYCVMLNHFHLLVRSLSGQLSDVMQWVTNQYARGFNRARRRDGPLLRGPFGSQLIEDSVYWETVVRYIDLNPVGVFCDLPSDYPHGSATAYRFRRGPGWLSKSLVAGTACDPVPWTSGPIPDYDSFAMCISHAAVAAIVESHLVTGRRSRSAGSGPMRYDDLVRGASLRQQSWMEFKSRLADGTAPGALILVPATIRRLTTNCRGWSPQARAGKRATPGSLWDVMEVGALRDLCGLTLQSVSEATGKSVAMVHKRHVRHRVLVDRDARYRSLLTRIARRAVDRDFPARRHSLALPARVAGNRLDGDASSG